MRGSSHAYITNQKKAKIMINLNAKRFEDVLDYPSLFEATHNKELQVKLGRVTVHKAEAQWL